MLRLVGHKGEVRSVAYLPDGRVVSGGADRTVRVWNPADGECLAVVPAKAPVYALAADPRTGHVAFAGRNPTRGLTNVVRTFDPGTGKLVETRKVSVEEDVWAFDRTTYAARRERQVVPRSIWALTHSGDGGYLVAAFRKPGGANEPDGAGGYWWRAAPPAEGPLAWPDVYSTTFAASGTRMAHTCEGRVVVCDSPEADQLVCEYPIQNTWAAGVAFTPAGDQLVIAAASFLHFVTIGSPSKPSKGKVKTGFRAVNSVAISPDGRTVLAGGKPSAVEVYDVASRAMVTSYDFDVGSVYAVAFAPDGLTFAVAGYEGLAVCDVDY